MQHFSKKYTFCQTSKNAVWPQVFRAKKNPVKMSTGPRYPEINWVGIGISDNEIYFTS